MDRAKIATILALILVLILGNKLREFSYASVPNPGEVRDEYSFGWLGISILKYRYPIAWSGIAGYKEHDLQKINVDNIFDKNPEAPLFPIDKPWFDHPPLFGLVTGGYAYLKGADQFVDASVILLRRPMLKIALLTTIMIFILATRLYGRSVGLLSALLYSTIPTTVISSRLALAENGYVPLFLAAIVLAHYYLSNKEIRYWYMAVVFAAIALLFKLSAVAIAISLFFVVLAYGKGKKKYLVLTLFAGVIGAVALWILYGAYFDFGTFVNVFQTNSQRFYGVGSEIFFSALHHFPIAGRNLTDGWILASWIALFILVFTEYKKNRSGTFITIAVFSYFAVFVLYGSEAYGWYRIPFFPFLVISLARLLQLLWKEPNPFLFSALMFLPLGTSIHRLAGVVEFQRYIGETRMLLAIILFVFFLSIAKFSKNTVIQRIFIIVMISFAVILSIKEIYFYTVDNWYFAT